MILYHVACPYFGSWKKFILINSFNTPDINNWQVDLYETCIVKPISCCLQYTPWFYSSNQLPSSSLCSSSSSSAVEGFRLGQTGYQLLQDGIVFDNLLCPRSGRAALKTRAKTHQIVEILIIIFARFRVPGFRLGTTYTWVPS